MKKSRSRAKATKSVMSAFYKTGAPLVTCGCRRSEHNSAVWLLFMPIVFAQPRLRSFPELCFQIVRSSSKRHVGLPVHAFRPGRQTRHNSTCPLPKQSAKPKCLAELTVLRARKFCRVASPCAKSATIRIEDRAATIAIRICEPVSETAEGARRAENPNDEAFLDYVVGSNATKLSDLDLFCVFTNHQ